MNILPVLDLLEGIVVRGIAGRRTEYRPVVSRLTASSQAIDVALAIRTAFGFDQFYVADLDAIQHGRPNWDLYRDLVKEGFRLQIDAGVQNVEDSVCLAQHGEPIIGLESCSSPEILAAIQLANQGEVTFSLDLREGKPLLTDGAPGWKSQPVEIVRQATACGVTRIIVLDLADVGTSNGGRTEGLCAELLREFPGIQLTCGGGVRGPDDLVRLRRTGLTSVLVASALHDGRLTASDMADFR